MSDSNKKPLIPSRVMLIGEEGIPRHLLDQLRDDQMQILLREPNPADWPQDMRWLTAYLPREERIRSLIAFAIADQEGLLNASLQRWMMSVCNSLSEQGLLDSQSERLILDEATTQIGALVAKLLHERILSITPQA